MVALFYLLPLDRWEGGGRLRRPHRKERACLAVATQMLLHLVILGLGIKVILGVVSRGRLISDTAESGI